jgi:hypothetical protein
MDVCGIPCPTAHPKPDASFGIGIGIMVAFFCAIGISAFYFVGGKAENFFVAVGAVQQKFEAVVVVVCCCCRCCCCCGCCCCCCTLLYKLSAVVDLQLESARCHNP